MRTNLQGAHGLDKCDVRNGEKYCFCRKNGTQSFQLS